MKDEILLENLLNIKDEISQTKEISSRTENKLDNFLNTRLDTCPLKKERYKLLHANKKNKIAIIAIILSALVGLSGWSAIIIGG